MWRLVTPHKSRVLVLAAASFFGGAVEAAFLVVITRTALAVADGDDSFGVLAGLYMSVGAAIAVAGALLIVRLGLALLCVRASTSLTIQVAATARADLADAYLRSSWATQQAEPSGRLQELLIAFAGAAAGVVSSFCNALIGALNLAALIIASVLINPIATLVVVAALLVLGTTLAPLRTRISARWATAAAAQMSFATSVSELGALGMEMQAYGVREQFSGRVRQLIAENARAGREAGLMQGALSPVYTFLAYGALLGGLAVATALDATELDGVAAVMLVMMRALSYGQQLQTSSGALMASLPYLDTIDATLDRYLESPATDGDVAVEEVGTIDVRSVSFAYQPGVSVLHDLSFDIGRGEVIGVIGPSGSGKSTLVQLLLGLRDPTSGRIVVGGVDLSDVKRSSWSHRVSFVAQDALLLSGTVADNIAFFREEIDSRDIERAARQANIHDEIVAMPNGFDSDVGERGSRLSGGQRQRVSIARALAGGPQLLIMDEPTSALDVRSDSLIRQTIAELKGRVTVVIIAHRMSTLDVCDRIMILQNGHLKAIDTPAALARDNDFYRESLELSGMIS